VHAGWSNASYLYRVWLLSTGRAEVELEPDGEDLTGEQ
jgi:hypothetical protein